MTFGYVLSIPAALARAAAGFLYPPQCLVCRCPTADPRESICPGCLRSAIRAGPDHPARLSAASRLRSTGLIVGFACVYLFEGSSAGGTVRDALHLAKYSGMHSIAVRFGRELAGELVSAGAPVSDLVRQGCVLVPVPLHPARWRERGYNQSERICAGLSAASGIPVDARALRRVRNTPSQTGLGLHERERNVGGAFRCGTGLRDRRVVLVDDVMTTGSTLAACAAALLDGGAASVAAAAIAVAERPGDPR